jgi:hypothetical protein
MTRIIATAIVGIALLTTQTSCAALVVGYLVGDAIAKDKATATCRSNLQTQNQARIAHGQEPMMDMCGR